jgi:hypothetical protein
MIKRRLPEKDLQIAEHVREQESHQEQSCDRHHGFQRN